MNTSIRAVSTQACKHLKRDARHRSCRPPSISVGCSGSAGGLEDDWSGLMHFCRSRFRIRQSPRQSSTIAATSGLDVMTTKTALIARMALLVLLLACLGQVPALADEFVDDLKRCYGFTNWVGNTETNYSCLVTNWVPNFTMFGVSNLISALEGPWANGSKNSDYFFHPTNKPDAIVHLRVQETPSVTDAHNVMMNVFGTCSAIQPFHVGTTNALKVGDRCYLGYPPNTYSGIFFVRNNVFIIVSAGSTNYSVRTIAVDLDNQLKAISLSGCAMAAGDRINRGAEIP